MALEQIGLAAILDDKNFQEGLSRYQKGVSQMEKSTDSAANVLTRLGSVASGTLVVGLGAATVAFGTLTAVATKGLGELQQWGEGIDKLGDQFGLTGEKASGFAFLASKVGAPVDELGFALNSLTNGLQGVQDRIKSGSKTISPFEKSLSQLGISALKSNGKLKTFDELLPELMDAFKKLPPGIKASSVAMDIFGTRGGGKMLDFLRQGSAGLTEATKKAKAFGLELSSEESDAVEKFGQTMAELTTGLKGPWVQIGLAVLPIAQKLADFFITKIPIMVQYAKKLGEALTAIVHGFSTGDWFPIFDILDKAFGRDVANKIGTFILAIQGLANAFRSGGLAGAIDEFGRLLGKAFENFDLSKSLGDIGGKVAGVISAAWTKISPELTKWGTQFWEWLVGKNGKGGALNEAGTQLGKVTTAITDWIVKNGPAGWKLIESWAGNFWNWLTDTKGGLLITVADNMGKLATTIEKWATDPETVMRFQQIGEDLARDVINGIGNFFTNPSPSGENIILRLWNTLNNARIALTNTIASIGGAFAGGIVGGIVGFFLGEDARNRVTQAMTQFFTELQRIMLSPGGPIVGFVSAVIGGAIAEFQRQWSIFINSGLFNFSAPGFGGSAGAGNQTPLGPGFASGIKYVPYDMNARIHAGEMILNRQQAQAFAPMLSQPVNRVNNIEVNAPISGTFNAADSGSMARVAQQIADATVRAVLNAA